MMKMVSIAIVTLASSAGAVAGDIAAGEKTFKKCVPSHSIGETAKNSIGPIQNGLKGRGRFAVATRLRGAATI